VLLPHHRDCRATKFQPQQHDAVPYKSLKADECLPSLLTFAGSFRVGRQAIAEHMLSGRVVEERRLHLWHQYAMCSKR
jgi:hypothetical protein